MVLNSVVPLQVNVFTSIPQAAGRAFDVLFQGCAADRFCNTTYPHLQAALEQLSHALEAARHLPTVDQVPLYRACGQLAEWLGDFEAACSYFEQMSQGAQAAGDRQMEWQSLIHLGNLWDERDKTTAGDYYRRALELARALDDLGNYTLSQKCLAECLAHQEEPALAIVMLEESLHAFEQQANLPMVAQVLQVLGVAGLFAGQRRLALSSLDRAIALLRTSQDPWYLVVCLALRTLVASPALTETVSYIPGQLATCQQDLQEALRVADAIEWPAGEALAHWLGGWMLASFGDLGQALSHSRAALEMARDLEQRHYLVGSHNSAGDVLLALLDPVQAKATLQAGLEIGHLLGAAVHLDNMTVSLQGKSNREIAAALFISQRTVGTHIGHMYDKLGIATRAQLVAWAIEKGLVAAPPR